jgi:hypothetical protein
MQIRNWTGALFIGLAVVVGLSVTSAVGCGGGPARKAATPQQLQTLGTRQYPDRTVDEVHTAVVTALRLQGYEIVTEQPMIRTAPKLVAMTSTASGNQYGATARSFDESVAWDIEVLDQGGKAAVIAKHRASVNGMNIDQVWEDWAQTNYKQLFDAIESSLPRPTAAAGPAPTAPMSSKVPAK